MHLVFGACALNPASGACCGETRLSLEMCSPASAIAAFCFAHLSPSASCQPVQPGALSEAEMPNPAPLSCCSCPSCCWCLCCCPSWCQCLYSRQGSSSLAHCCLGPLFGSTACAVGRGAVLLSCLIVVWPIVAFWPTAGPSGQE